MTHWLNILVSEDEGAETALLCLLHPVGWNLPKLILEDLDIWYIYNMLTSQLLEGHCCCRIVFASLGPLWQTWFFCWIFYKKNKHGGTSLISRSVGVSSFRAIHKEMDENSCLQGGNFILDSKLTCTLHNAKHCNRISEKVYWYNCDGFKIFWKSHVYALGPLDFWLVEN